MVLIAGLFWSYLFLFYFYIYLLFVSFVCFGVCLLNSVSSYCMVDCFILTGHTPSDVLRVGAAELTGTSTYTC